MRKGSKLQEKRVFVPCEMVASWDLASVRPLLFRSGMLRIRPGLVPVWSQAAL